MLKNRAQESKYSKEYCKETGSITACRHAYVKAVTNGSDDRNDADSKKNSKTDKL